MNSVRAPSAGQGKKKTTRFSLIQPKSGPGNTLERKTVEEEEQPARMFRHAPFLKSPPDGPASGRYRPMAGTTAVPSPVLLH